MKNNELLEILAQGRSISNLTERELFLVEKAANIKQAALLQNYHLNQIEIEIELIKTNREILPLIGSNDDVPEISKTNLKIATYYLLELLNKLEKGTSHNDFTVLADLIALIIGYSPKNILNIIQKGIHFSKQHHGAVIEQLNKASKKASIPIFIRI